jgi:hypothetical protein
VRSSTGMTIVVSLEAFLGLLFGSVCGAVIFAKVTRIQTWAQVNFSHPIVIRYGSGVVEDLHHCQEAQAAMLGKGRRNRSNNNTIDKNNASSIGTHKFNAEPVAMMRVPWPVLEFRVVNRLVARVGGEIVGGSIRAVVTVDEDQALPVINKKFRNMRSDKHYQKNDPHLSGLSSIESSENDYAVTIKSSHRPFEEDLSGHLIHRRVFCKVRAR